MMIKKTKWFLRCSMIAICSSAIGCTALTEHRQSKEAAGAPVTEKAPEAPTPTWGEIIQSRRAPSVSYHEVPRRVARAEEELAALEAQQASGQADIPPELRINRIRLSLEGLQRTDSKDRAEELWGQTEVFRALLPPNTGLADEYHSPDFQDLVSRADGLFGHINPFVTGSIYERGPAARRLGYELTVDDLDARISDLGLSLEKYEAALGGESLRARAVVTYVTQLGQGQRENVAAYHARKEAFAEAVRKDARAQRMFKQLSDLDEQIRLEEIRTKTSVTQCHGPGGLGREKEKLCRLDRERNALRKKSDKRIDQIRSQVWP